MRLITIKNKYGMMASHEGRIDGSRREFVVTGEIEIYLLGAYTPMEYETACNLAMNIVEGMNIRPSQLVRVNRPKPQRGYKIDKSQKSLF